MIVSLNVFGFEVFTLALGRVTEGFEYVSNNALDTEIEDDEDETIAFGFQGDAR